MVAEKHYSAQELTVPALELHLVQSGVPVAQASMRASDHRHPGRDLPGEVVLVARTVAIRTMGSAVEHPAKRAAVVVVLPMGLHFSTRGPPVCLPYILAHSRSDSMGLPLPPKSTVQWLPLLRYVVLLPSQVVLPWPQYHWSSPSASGPSRHSALPSGPSRDTPLGNYSFKNNE
jgi:hypothetical protein